MEKEIKTIQEIENITQFIINQIVFQIFEVNDCIYYNKLINLVYILDKYNRSKILKEVNKCMCYNKHKNIFKIHSLLHNPKVHNGLYNIYSVLEIIHEKYKDIEVTHYILYINKQIQELENSWREIDKNFE